MSHHHCHDASCQIHGHESGGPGSGSCPSCGCHSSCSCGCHSQGKDSCADFPAKFLELADCAWMEALKEKIKDQVLKNDNKLDELAKIIGEANRERWKHKKEKFKGCQDFEDKLKNIMSKS